MENPSVTDSQSPSKGKLDVTLASDIDGWNNIVNEQLVIELAKDPRLRVSGFVPHNTPKQREHARSLNIELVDAEDFSGFSQIELLSHPPDNLNIDILLIHSYGSDLGRQAQVIQKHKKCKWAQVVHTISNELHKFLEEPDEHEHKLQITLCEMADVIIAIGPKVAEAYKRALQCSGQHKNVFELTPGVIEQLIGVRQVYEDDHADEFHVLFSGSSKYFKVKGCDIAAQAIKLLNTPSYHLIVVLRPCESENVVEITQALLNEGIDPYQLSVRISESHEDWHGWLCKVDLVIKPSRTEGFGMSGLLAISANVPVLVSGYTGLGVVLKKMSSGANHVVESDDPQVWADKIKEVREKDSPTCRLEAEELRNEYMRQFKWKEQCNALVETFCEMFQNNHEGAMSSAQNLDPCRSVDGIQRQVQETSLADNDSTMETTVASSCDVVDAGVKMNKRQVNNRLSTKVTDVSLTVYSRVCAMLNSKRDLRFNDFRMLAEKVGLKRDETDSIEQTCSNYTDEILKTWSTKSRQAEATVEKLIELLKEGGFERMDVAEILEDWVNDN